jgi:integrase/recombinase XerD
MRFQHALDNYVKYLNETGYSKGEIANKKAHLSIRFSYALTLFDPAMPDSLEKIDRPGFYSHGRICFDERSGKIERVHDFLDMLKKEQREIRYINLSSFLQAHQEELFHENESIHQFLRALGFSIDLKTITAKVFRQSMDYFRAQPGKIGVESCSRSFFRYCFNQGWTAFRPNTEKRGVYTRTFEPDFLAEVTGRWRRWLEDYLDYLRFEKNLSDGGVDYQMRKLKVFAVWLSEHKVKRPNTELVKQFLNSRKEAGVKDVTLSKYLYTIKYFFDFMTSNGQLKTNPARELRIKNRCYAEGEVLSEQEVCEIIEYLDEEVSQKQKQTGIVGHKYHLIATRNLCMFHILISTGVRLSELAGMRLQDIDWSKKTIYITAKGNRNVRQQMRQIQLDDYVCEVLQSYLEVRKEPGEEYLWISRNIAPLSNSSINLIVKTMIKKAGIRKRISPHRLRATCASRYLRNGMDPLTLKTIMGHQSIATTMDQYVQLTEEELREIWKRTNPLAGMNDE